jgi:exodeoxyribonuclease V alpha subunit
MTTIVGEVERVKIFSDTWGIATLRDAESGERFTAVGPVMRLEEGEPVELAGDWHMHPRHGRQFKVTGVRVAEPIGELGAVRWIARTLPNFGEVRAQALVDMLGSAEETWRVIEHEPHRLAEVRGITARMVDKIREVYFAEKTEREEIAQLLAWGLTEGQIIRIRKRWSSNCIEILQSNPYIVIEEIDGFGFKRADALGRRMGIAHEHAGRIAAGIVHVMREATNAGHTYLPTARIVEIAAGASVLGVPSPVVHAQARAMRVGDLLDIYGGRTRLPRIARAERAIAYRVADMLKERAAA